MKLNTKETYLIINKELQYAIEGSGDQETANDIQIGPINENNYRQLWIVEYKENDCCQIINGWTDNVITKDFTKFTLKRGEMHHRQLWTLEMKDPKHFYIRYTKSKNRYLGISNGKLELKDVRQQKEADLWLFQIVLNNSLLNQSCFIVQSQSGQLIDVPHGSKKSGEQLIIWKEHHRFNQRWNIYKAGEIYVIKSFYNRLNLDVSQQKYEEGNSILQYQSYGNMNQFWRFQKIEERKYRITPCMNKEMELGFHHHKLVLNKGRKVVWEIQGYFPQ